ncbi:MacB family efflux pump subunit [Thauera linaloolentis]|uniref:Pyoverdine export ATP-binding/permease protein PvdT n=1 Tax=Thauera linaloolentis (strain DSM 12138 / JCM 21573 / CCUG 41526 / CIP 105981 / IAM 15112 / NBRC 102519 / 47Lol) TaxID=1123367 RepID=N6YXW2_THAL4|nr:MacB family efflux pump subunit [Thauera linaloolentis]ENO86978.1 macrolide export ATP-binding/permease MacB [Thauera linaloolentis 47Lol = DSM 12138]MCM8564438.1 MacB family efflux pump subunit [Thauera linaloolentis]
MGEPLIRIDAAWREFAAGDQRVAALRNVSLDIHAGEMVAIVGASGSGKSTLMNLLGCLDRPTRGDYRLAGHSVPGLAPDELARLRREHFGFIFQRYHLLPDLSAQANVEAPALYAGLPAAQRHRRARELLARLGLAARAGHRPGQLSGGQQQRVAIARALMNGGRVLLADEPTGALDRHSGQEVMDILRELHRAGHTVVLVTHDMQVARHAGRIVELADGEVIADRPNLVTAAAAPATPPAEPAPTPIAATPWRAARDRALEALRMALLAMSAHRLRSFLTMLGIIIGVASVASVVAVGEGSRRQVLAQIDQLGTSTIEVWAGRNWGDTDAERQIALRPQDAAALAGEAYLAGASPVLQTTLQVRHGNVTASANLTGVNEQYFAILGLRLAAGASFGADAVARRAQDVVIDPAARKTLFPGGEDPLGQVIMLGGVPARVVGVAAPGAALNRWPGGRNPAIFAPYTTVGDRITGQTRLDSIVMRVREGASAAAAEHAVLHLLALRRGNDEVFVQNADGVRQAAEATSATLTLLISTIALISLLVGGIGVMNIMLVSVSERTREIGVRMAVGARRADILLQFLIEAVLVCLIGGALGIALSFAAGWLLDAFASSLKLVWSAPAIAAAFASSLLVGMVFGYLPARNAARLDPVVALERE